MINQDTTKKTTLSSVLSHMSKSATLVAAALFMTSAYQAQAVEGGSGAYFLGTRDSLSGIVPPPGTYLSFTYDRLEGSVAGISIGGFPIRADADITLDLIRLGVTQSFETNLWGAQPAVNLTIPIPNIDLGFTAVSPPISGRNINDDTFGVGDLTFTGMLGWNRGRWNYNTALSIFAPTGSYETATVNVSGGIANAQLDFLSNGKNRWAFQPVFAATHLNPETGLEFSGAASFIFSTKNEATDYQTAPAFQFEGAVMQRLPSGWGFGVAGYHYQQLYDDSGQGARNLRFALGASSLKARVSGLGPMVTYSGGTIFGGDMSLKAKYTKEFGAKRRLESDVLTLNMSLAF